MILTAAAPAQCAPRLLPSAATRCEATPEAEEEEVAVDVDDGLDPLGAAPPTPVPADRGPLQD